MKLHIKDYNDFKDINKQLKEGADLQTIIDMLLEKLDIVLGTKSQLNSSDGDMMLLELDRTSLKVLGNMKNLNDASKEIVLETVTRISKNILKVYKSYYLFVGAGISVIGIASVTLGVIINK